MTETAGQIEQIESTQERSIGDWIRLVLGGFLIGSGNVVPGVSGGTMAFILGVYEELVESLRMAGQPDFYRALLKLDIRNALRVVHAGFLLAIITGALLADFSHLYPVWNGCLSTSLY